jgi:AcrR family transcriptional regulator
VPAGRSRANLRIDDIVATALDLIRANGVENFSMRQLSESLGASLGATYRHLPTKTALLELCGKALFDRSWRPMRDGEDPLVWLQEQLMSLYDLLGQHRGLAAYVVQRPQVTSRDVAGPVHEVLLASGFSEDEAIVVGATLTLYLAGALLTDFEHSVAVDAADAHALVAAGIKFVLTRRPADPVPTKAGRPTKAVRAAAARRRVAN